MPQMPDDSHHAEDPRAIVDRLIDLLTLEKIEENFFRGKRTEEPWRRVFGGQVISQALMAACQTVEVARPAHSLHAYFMRPGDPDMPIMYEVFRDRDGASFTSRRVVAIQNGKPILNLAASFQKREKSPSHHFPMPDIPGPEGLLDERAIMTRLEAFTDAKRRTFLRSRPIEFRPVEQTMDSSGAPLPPAQSYWFRAAAPLPDDNILHRVLLAYASDMMLLTTGLRSHGVYWYTDRVQEASLDHALWIHEDFRLDDWLLYTMDSPWSGGARSINRGLVYTHDGRLVASVSQEGLMRIND